jgi:LuxR family transcriptional regulator, maltose regulon positive regulatory protein
MSNDSSPRDLLRTKVQIPPARARLVPRPRLTTRLDEGLHGKLILISATAGSGKTTLLEAWHRTAAGRRRPLAWLSLDASDSDWRRFWSYLIAALQTVTPDLGTSVMLSLHSIPLPEFAAASNEHARRESILTALLNELTALPQDLVLVLDDYHVIESSLIHESLAFFIDRLPDRLHLVIATREDPPLPLARWRVRDQLAEIRAADLQFTALETAAFCREVMQVPVTETEVHLLEERTEGWVAGLQMAALSLREHARAMEFIAAFHGSHRFILDYLSEEVLNRQPQDIQTFLLSTAVLDRMNAELCNAVTGRADSQALLERLDAANLFVVPLDDERSWYRYHRLFADLLRHQLQRAQADRLPEIHRRASCWFEGADLMAEAIQHAVAAHDLERAADLIEQATRRTWMPWMYDEIGTTVSALEALPTNLVYARPRLCLAYAWAHLVFGRIDRVEEYLQAATQAVGSPPYLLQAQAILSEVTVLRTFVASTRGEVASTIELARQAIDTLPVTEQLLRSIVYWSLGNAYALRADMLSAQQAQHEALAISRTVGNHAVALMALNQLAEIKCSLGQLRAGVRMLRETLELAQNWGGEHFFLLGRTWWTLALVHYEWSDLAQAEDCLNHSIHISTRWNYLRGLASAYGLLALVKQAQGDSAGACEMMHQAQQTAQESRNQMAVASYLTNQLWLWSAQGDLAPAMQWIQEHAAEWSDQNSHLHFVAGSAIARALIEFSRQQADSTWLPKAQQLLQQRLQQAETTGMLYDVVELLPLCSLGDHIQGRTAQALQLIKRALILAEPESYVRMFVDCGVLLAELLLIGLQNQAFREPPLQAYVARLLAHFKIPATNTPPFPAVVPSDAEGVIEPLTERELEVLQLLATGASDQIIADQLVLSKTTVKTHLRNIYGKLQVGNRTQAIARARVLHLLP